MKERWMVLACTLCLCTSPTLPAAAAGGYTDVPGGAWYEAVVNKVTERGYMTGVSEGQSAPIANVTRATAVTVLWRMEGSSAPMATVSSGNMFPKTWYAQPVAWVKENGIANGDSRGDFEPDQSAIRQELVAFLTRLDQYRGVPLVEGSLNLYSDANVTGVWVVENMRHAVGMGWLGGGGGRLLPGGVATRVQLVVILQRFTTRAMG